MKLQLSLAFLLSSVLSAQTLYVVDAFNSIYVESVSAGPAQKVGTIDPVNPKGLAHDGTTLYGLELGGSGGVLGRLFAISPATGALTLLGATGITGWQDFTWDPIGNRFYALNQNDNLYAVSLSGVATLIGSTKTTPVTTHVLTGIALDSSGALWAIDNTTGDLATLDKQSGLYQVAHPTGLTGWQAIAFEPSTGILYGTRNNGGNPSLYVIDKTTGAPNLVGTISGTNAIVGMRFVAPNCPSQQFQQNSTKAGLTLESVQGTPCTAAITHVLKGVTVHAYLSSSEIGQGWEVAASVSPLIPVSGGAWVFPGAQIFNLNLASGSLFFLNGGSAPDFSHPFPGDFTLPFTAPAFPVSLSVQLAVLDPSAPYGMVMSQACQLQVH